MHRTFLFLTALALMAPAAATQRLCRIKPFGDSCGPRLAGTHAIVNSRDVITFRVTRGLPNASGIYVFGIRKIGVELPVYGCKLLTEPLVLLAFRTDTRGVASTPITAPVPLSGKYYAQAASFTLSPNRLFASNGLEIECRNR